MKDLHIGQVSWAVSLVITRGHFGSLQECVLAHMNKPVAKEQLMKISPNQLWAVTEGLVEMQTSYED